MRGKIFLLGALAVPAAMLLVRYFFPAFGAHVRLDGVLGGTVGFWVLWAVAFAVTAPVPPELRDSFDRTAGDGTSLQSWPRAEATVAEFRDLGIRLQNMKMVGFVLQVGPEPQRVSHRQRVPDLALTRIEPGLKLVVRTHPADPQKVFIDWEATFPGVTPNGSGLAGLARS